MATGQLFYDPIARPLSSLGVSMPGGYYNFYVSGTTNPAQVFQDAGLTLPFPSAALNGSQPLFTVIQADGTGAMPPIFLNPKIIYRVQLYNSTFSLIEDVDPYVPPMPVTGNGQLTLDAQGEVTILAPVPGGTGVTLTLNTRSGGTALGIVGSAAGAPAITVNSSVVVGTQTATFVATNKPGAAGPIGPSKWLPITADSSTYYIPLWQ